VQLESSSRESCLHYIHPLPSFRSLRLSPPSSSQNWLTPSATGYLTGDQSKQTEGNLEAEKASMDYKQASSDAPLALPVPSAEGVKGKMESVAGMVTGDAELQKKGNVKAEGAAWKDGN
jgi:uncharacterized protein YjbJ (UPF0337 family)